MRPRVNIPLFQLEFRRTSGLQSATYNLAMGLHEVLGDITLSLTEINQLAAEFQQWTADNDTVHVDCHWSPFKTSIGSFINQEIFANTNHHKGWILYPNYFLPFARKSHAVKSAVIIHDCQHRVFPHYFSETRRLWLDFAFQYALDHADQIFLVSQFERDQIERYFGPKCLDRCKVIYNSINWSSLGGQEVDEAVCEEVKRPYILTVSQGYSHKNIGTVVNAFNLLAQDDPDMMLYLVGHVSEAVKKALLAICNEQTQKRIVFFGFISNTALGSLYRAARIFVLASRYEGFGMTAVEAMGLGVPALVSNSSALPEATLGLANYIDATAAASEWADRIKAILQQDRSRLGLESIAESIQENYNRVRVAQRVVSNL